MNGHPHPQMEGWGEQQGNMRPKKDQQPVGQTPNPAALCPASGAHDGITWASKGFGNSSSAIDCTHSFCLGLTPLHACSFPPVVPTVLTPPPSCTQHRSLHFTFTCSQARLLRAHFLRLQPCYRLPGLSASWNSSASLHDNFSLASFTPVCQSMWVTSHSSAVTWPSYMSILVKGFPG